ncbi:hypothetical protein AAG906_021013 [Vitis piasezkii]
MREGPALRVSKEKERGQRCSRLPPYVSTNVIATVCTVHNSVPYLSVPRPFPTQINPIILCVDPRSTKFLANNPVLTIQQPNNATPNPPTKLLIRAGAHVTFVTSSSAGTRMSKSPTLDGLEFVTFSDGYDHGFDHGDGLQNFISSWPELMKVVPLLAYSMLIGNKGNGSSSSIELPGLPLLSSTINKFKLMGIGPLLPSAFLDGKDPSDTSFGGDLFRGSKDYIQWLNSNAESSVIYVSFGSLSVLSKQQSEEIARGLLDSGRPFLWVIRAKENEEEEKEDKLSCVEELEQLGMIVPWCSQVEVLSHPSLGCFVSHCGLRVMVNQEGIVEGGEIKKCLELVMGGGERGQEVRSNAKKWKDLAREAVKDGGSSDKNLKNFVDELIQGH